MKASEIRQKFLDFFESKGHQIVPSAPIVVKNDPTLMFNNAGMNQFKDYFLGNSVAKSKRIADTQKCLRVSGKHNDLEEVGIDSYHHTMFEMLGNWSFGDYFKKEAIDWAWELLTEVYGLQKDRLYISIFEGDNKDNLERDAEAEQLWLKHVPQNRILEFDRKDNFWEMGDTGPCGPCSEIHIDLRPDDEREKLDGSKLVNEDHPLVIEIWNLVFIQFNRKADGSLEDLPEKHVDTGMGFERLAMAIQGKTSNYDTDLFTPFIQRIEEYTGLKYTGDYALSAKSDIAMRVVVDHVRAVSFTIADGELPSNTGAGYVIRRILRRAIRYYYSFLNVKKPFIHTLVEPLGEHFREVFPELIQQRSFVAKVIEEEERSFLKTLEGGLKRFESLKIDSGVIDGQEAFELYDTFGFPIDLTRLIASEKGLKVDEENFSKALEAQRQRGRQDADRVVGDWVIIEDDNHTEFVGYDNLEVNESQISKYRIVEEKGKEVFQLVLNKTPFYAEGGGQVGDSGVLKVGEEFVKVLDTKKENDLIIHYVDKLPREFKVNVHANVNEQRRAHIEGNHSATHILHAALRQVLGDHVQQKGSLVNESYLRFDFAHFQKMSEEEIKEVEHICNQRIRQNIPLKEDRSIPIEDAKEAGAMMLFGEKYGDFVRMITFDSEYSAELCGGCHVQSTGKIGIFKIKGESGIAAGVRRIEAVTGFLGEAFVNRQIEELKQVKALFKSPLEAHVLVQNLLEENKALKKEMDKLVSLKANSMQEDLLAKAETVNGIKLIRSKVDLDSKAAKTLAHNLGKSLNSGVVCFGMQSDGKAQLMLLVTKDLVDGKEINAGSIIREIAKEINGGGGGQAFFATAGGANPAGLDQALAKLENHL